MGTTQWQLGTSVSSEHLVNDQGNPRKLSHTEIMHLARTTNKMGVNASKRI